MDTTLIMVAAINESKLQFNMQNKQNSHIDEITCHGNFIEEAN